jgi:pimeloyl-ACP methyl ester carboxylesterase
MALSTFADGRLWGARYGAGRPWILALHGWGRDHGDFDTVLAGLDAVAIDLPGFGVAPEPREPWSTEQYAQFVAPVLEEMVNGPVVVIGHSFGARVAVHLAGPTAQLAPSGPTAQPRDAAPPVRAPAAGKAAPGASCLRAGRIGALVLTGAPLAPDPDRKPVRPAATYRVGRALHRLGLLSDQRMERIRRRSGSEDYRRASEVMRSVLVKAVSETASSAYMPSLREWASAGGSLELVWGELDRVASLKGVQAALRTQRGAPASATVTVVPGAGHLVTPGLAEAVRAAALRHRPLV